jgi:type VI secretion system secreted protein Hcp
MDSRAKQVVAVAAVAAGLAATTPAAADDATMVIPGVPGESTVAGHNNEIDIVSWSWGVLGGSGSNTVHALTITKRLDKSTPSLSQGLSGSIKAGIGVKGAITLNVRRNTAGDAGLKGPTGSIANGTDFLKLAITDAKIVAIKYSQSDGRPMEQITFSFSSASYTYSGPGGGTTQISGSAGAVNQNDWDSKM